MKLVKVGKPQLFTVEVSRDELLTLVAIDTCIAGSLYAEKVKP